LTIGGFRAARARWFSLHRGAAADMTQFDGSLARSVHSYRKS
jgi:hypothetical protein